MFLLLLLQVGAVQVNDSLSHCAPFVSCLSLPCPSGLSLCHCRSGPAAPPPELRCAQSSNQRSPACSVFKHQGFNQYSSHRLLCYVVNDQSSRNCQYILVLSATCLPVCSGVSSSPAVPCQSPLVQTHTLHYIH